MGMYLSRRQFIKSSTIGIAAAGSIMAVSRIFPDSSSKELPDPYPVLPDEEIVINPPSKEPLFFNDHQYSLVAVLAALIVPTDDSPGAAESGVADYIDSLTAKSERKQKQYTEGLNWLDNVCQTQYGKGFLSLTVSDQIELLMDIEEAERKIYRRVSGLLERVDRKIDEVLIDLFGVGKSSLFFRTIRKDVFSGYYSNPVSWKVVGYYGPPQPLGYPDNSRPPSSDNYIDTLRPINNTPCQNCHFDQVGNRDHEEETDCMDCHEPHFPFLGT